MCLAMRTAASITSVLGLCLAGIGCNGIPKQEDDAPPQEMAPQKIVGRWRDNYPPDKETKVYMTFGRDGTWSETYNRGDVSMEASGTYIESNSQLSISAHKVILPDGKVQEGSQNYFFALKWLNKDRFELQGMGIAYRFTKE